MNLQQRLAFRNKAAGGGHRVEREGGTDAAGELGFEHARVEVQAGEVLARSRACPPGFETLRVPTAAATAAAMRRIAPGPCLPERPVVAVDLETAGLTGAVVAFIACAAWHEGDRVVVEQFTLMRTEAERAFLRAFCERLREVTQGRTRLLSFNGASFDLPRLRERLLRLALPDPSRDRHHLDLVVAARRLYKGVTPDCRLSTLEREVLGVRRRGDIDGAEVAAIFGRLAAHPGDDWVRDEVRLAARHNQADVLGLIALLDAVAGALQRPTTVHEAVRCARHDLRIGRVDAAVAALEPRVRNAMHRDAGTDAVDAAMLLADVYRVGRRFEDAARLWAWVCECTPGHAAAHEALAKHLEHRTRSPAAALRVAAASASPCARRLARLRRKAGEISA